MYPQTDHDHKNVHHYANYCWSQTNKSTK